MKTINVGKQLALVDDEDYPVLSRLKWYVDISTGQPVAHLWKDRTLAVRMNRFLKPYKVNFKLMYKDGNPMNNQKNNLIYATETQIRQKASKRSKCSSKYKGVTYSPERKGNKWLARIYQDGKKTFLGYHATQKEAAVAYNVAALDMYGESAFINMFGER